MYTTPRIIVTEVEEDVRTLADMIYQVVDTFVSHMIAHIAGEVKREKVVSKRVK